MELDLDGLGAAESGSRTFQGGTQAASVGHLLEVRVSCDGSRNVREV